MCTCEHTIPELSRRIFIAQEYENQGARQLVALKTAQGFVYLESNLKITCRFNEAIAPSFFQATELKKEVVRSC